MPLNFGSGMTVEIIPPSVPVITLAPPSIPSQLIVPVAGIQGPQGTPGGSIVNYHQASPAATWVINHGLNRYPSVTLFDDTNTVFLTDIIYSSLNTVTVVNSSPITGTAILE